MGSGVKRRPPPYLFLRFFAGGAQEPSSPRRPPPAPIHPNRRCPALYLATLAKLRRRHCPMLGALTCAVDGNGAVMPGEVDFEMHARCHQRRYASSARPVFKGDDADLREALQGAREARLLASGEGRQLAHRSGPMALYGVEHGKV